MWSTKGFLLSSEIKGQVVLLGRIERFNLLEPRIELLVAGPELRFQPMECVVDTGFTGWLTLPAQLIRELDLNYYGSRDSTIADGRQIRIETYQAFARWNDRPVPILVHRSENPRPLVGAAMLENCRLIVDMWPGGGVTIVPNP